MTTKPTLHIPLKDSPVTTLLSSINTGDTILQLGDSSEFEAAGITRLTIGVNTDETETVTVESYESNNEVVVTRSASPKSWLAGAQVTRLLNAVDISEIQQYLTYLDENLVTNGDSHDHSGGDGAQIPEGGIATGAVTETKIGTDAVTNSKIAAGAVDTDEIAAEAITESKIEDGAVTNAKLADHFDTLYSIILDKGTALEVGDGIGDVFFIPERHDGKKAVKLWAGLPDAVSSSGDVTIRFYNQTQIEVIGSITITQGDRVGTLVVDYLLTSNDRIRIDCISAGTGVMGLHTQMEVDKS